MQQALNVDVGTLGLTLAGFTLGTMATFFFVSRLLENFGPKGELWIVEIKSSLIDYRVDAKWPNYKDYCDRFFFAKPPELEAEIFPPDEGLIVGDGHGAEILRPAAETPLAPARRKALLLKLVRLGADRVHQLMDPLTNGDAG
jgi:hypothetical protein